jgi:uncharacterized membrane protein
VNGKEYNLKHIIFHYKIVLFSVSAFLCLSGEMRSLNPETINFSLLLKSFSFK